MTTTICYEEKETGNIYLISFTRQSIEEAQRLADETNRTKANKLWWTGEKLNWNKIERIVISEQEDIF